MSYQVLARKWRPRTFAEMAGQEHVLRALKNALEQDRLHHAYLFSGTRGVGKTTVARVLAKALNCEQGVSAEPCGQCSACVEIDQGRFIDLIEVDAASRTKVEDTRELLDNVQYTPTNGRYKIYLIDEVHMLSTHSFNALLKTLEEPPPHVKFLLATTDPQKLPATVLSRCLQFNLKRMAPDLIEQQLIRILDAENIPYEVGALKYISHSADGSMRDALSLLDQVIAYSEGNIKATEVANMLGYLSREPLYAIVDALIAKDANELIAVVGKVYELAGDFAVLLDDLISLFQQLALAQWVDKAPDNAFDDMQKIQQFSQAISEEDIQLYYQIALVGKRDLNLSPSPRRGVEMTLLRMLAFQPAAIEDLQTSKTNTKPLLAKPAQPEQKEVTKVDKPAQPEQTAATPAVVETTTESVTGADWKAIHNALHLKGIVAELAANCAIKEQSEQKLVLLLSPKHEQLYSAAFEKRIADAVSKYFAKPIQVKIEIGESANESPAAEQARLSEEKQQAAVDAMQADPFVQSLKETFDAELDTDSVQPAN